MLDFNVSPDELLMESFLVLVDYALYYDAGADP